MTRRKLDPRLLAGRIVVHILVATFTRRDIPRRDPSQIRGPNGCGGLPAQHKPATRSPTGFRANVDGPSERSLAPGQPGRRKYLSRSLNVAEGHLHRSDWSARSHEGHKRMESMEDELIIISTAAHAPAARDHWPQIRSQCSPKNDDNRLAYVASALNVIRHASLRPCFRS